MGRPVPEVRQSWQTVKKLDTSSGAPRGPLANQPLAHLNGTSARDIRRLAVANPKRLLCRGPMFIAVDDRHGGANVFSLRPFHAFNVMGKGP